MLLSRSLFVLLAILLVPSPIVAQVTFSQVAITGGEAPGVEGAEFGGFNPGIGPGGPAINASGDVAFKTLLTGTGPDVRAIFGPTSGAGSPLGLLAQEGVPAPGVDDGAELSLRFNHLSLNASGDVAFLGAENISTIFGPTSGAGSPLGPVVQGGIQAPGMDDGVLLSFFGFPALNASGDIAFEAGFSSGSAVFGPTAGAGSSLGPIAQQNEVAPGVDDGAVFGPLTGEFFELSLNASGDVAFGAILRTEPGLGFPPEGEFAGTAIFGPTAGTGSPLGLIVRSGDPAPGVGDGAVFGGVQMPLMLNDSGDVVFTASLGTGTGNEVNSNNNTAIFGPTAGAGSPLGLIVRENTPAPGVDDGATFDNFTFRNSSSPSLNASGDISFVAELRTGTGDVVDESNDAGLFTAVDGEFQLVVREGDLFTVTLPDGSSTEDRTISSIVFSQNGMNDAGMLVFILNFTDGTQGIFTAVNSPVLLGDVNRDGVVDFLDISPFIAVLALNGFQAEADTNEDGEVNFLDIPPFIFFLAS